MIVFSAFLEAEEEPGSLKVFAKLVNREHTHDRIYFLLNEVMLHKLKTRQKFELLLN
jgi:hypothetical protein